MWDRLLTAYLRVKDTKYKHRFLVEDLFNHVALLTLMIVLDSEPAVHYWDYWKTTE